MPRIIMILCVLGSAGWAQDGGEMEGQIIPLQRQVKLEGDLLGLFSAICGQPANSFRNGSRGWLGFDGVLPLAPAASSELKNDGYGPYGAEQGTDGTINTVWSEGVAGPGIGQWLADQSPYPGDVVLLYGGHPGTGWRANNRLKRGRIYIFSLRGVSGAPGGQPSLEVAEALTELAISLSDEPGWRYIPLTLDFPDADAYLSVLVIDEVWRGSRWNDTVIAEFGLTVSQ